MSNKTADTILAQLGGNRFLAMTGAKHLVAGPDFLQFAIGRGATNKANKVKITLSGSDLYDLSFYSIRGTNIKDCGSVTMVYGDRLAEVFTEQTGFDTHL